MQESGVILPDRSQIQKWNNLGEAPLVETTSRYVPRVAFLSECIDADVERIPSVAAGVSASVTMANIKQLSEYEKIMDQHKFYIYPLRSVTPNLEKNITVNGKNKKQAEQIAIETLSKIIEPLKNFKADCEQITIYLKGLFINQTVWCQANYSDELVDHIFRVIYKMESLSQMIPTRKAVSDDISKVSKIAGPTAVQSYPHDLRFFNNTPTAVRNLLLQELAKMPPELVQKVASIMFQRIESRLRSDSIILAEDETMYIVAMMFMIDFVTKAQQFEKAAKKDQKKPIYEVKDVPSSILTLLLEQRSKHPALLLVYEFPLAFDEFLNVSPFLRQIKGPPPRYQADLKGTMANLRNLYTDLVAHGARLNNNEESQDLTDYYMKTIPQTLRQLSLAIRMLCELFADKILNAGIDDHTKSDNKGGDDNGKSDASESAPVSAYERAMRFHFSDAERENTMLILAICSSIRELLQDSMPRLQALISCSIQATVQDFIKNKLELTLFRLQTKKGFDPSDITKLRAFIGYFNSDADLEVRFDKIRDIERNPHDIDASHAAPHASLVELLRTQVQMILNPDSSYMHKQGVFSGRILDQVDYDEFSAFLEKSEHFVDLLDLKILLEKASDTSTLFFKEYHLDTYRTGNGEASSNSTLYFPVTTSLPYILIDYTINHPDKQELLGVIYYPLSIYDDAAAVALKSMRCQYLFNEIRAEVEICMMTITKMISEFAFNKVREYCTQCFLDQYQPHLLDLPRAIDPSGMRFPLVLQQNNLFLLGTQIDLKSIFAQRLNELFMSNLDQAVKPVRRHGLLAILLMTNTVNILRDTHALFLQHGLPLASFEDLQSQAMLTHTPASFRSHILDLVINHLTDSVIPTYSLHTNPLRLVPAQDVDAKTLFGKGRAPDALRATTAFITVEHFRALLDLVDDGGALLLASHLRSLVSELFEAIVAAYEVIRPNIRRISDVPIGTGCHRAYDLFEGAYRSFIADPAVDEFFEAMRHLGNLIALSNMLDIAFNLARSARQQSFAYIFGTEPKDIDARSNEFFSLFDDTFKKTARYFEGAETAPPASQVAPPFMQQTVERVAAEFAKHSRVFKESSNNIFDFPSLTGFAAVWSVLEFVFCLKDVHRRESGDAARSRGAFSFFGEGVLLCASTIMAVAHEADLYKVLCIGDRILQQKVTDLAVLDEELMTKFLTVFQLVSAAEKFAILSIAPTINA